MDTPMQVTAIHGEGNVVFQTAKFWLEADTMDYDPATHVAVITALPGHRVRSREVGGGAGHGIYQASYDEIEVNTQTWEIVGSKGFSSN